MLPWWWREWMYIIGHDMWMCDLVSSRLALSAPCSWRGVSVMDPDPDLDSALIGVCEDASALSLQRNSVQVRHNTHSQHTHNTLTTHTHTHTPWQYEDTTRFDCYISFIWWLQFGCQIMISFMNSIANNIRLSHHMWSIWMFWLSQKYIFCVWLLWLTDDSSPHTGLREYAIIAAQQDTRFNPIASSEITSLRCDLSLLTDFEVMKQGDVYNWTIGTHGITIQFDDPITRRNYHATFLPDVAKEQGWSREETLEELIHKAGYRGRLDAVKDRIHITRYQSQKDSLTYDEYQTLRAHIIKQHAITNHNSNSSVIILPHTNHDDNDDTQNGDSVSQHAIQVAAAIKSHAHALHQRPTVHINQTVDNDDDDEDDDDDMDEEWWWQWDEDWWHSLLVSNAAYSHSSHLHFTILFFSFYTLSSPLLSSPLPECWFSFIRIFCEFTLLPLTAWHEWDIVIHVLIILILTPSFSACHLLSWWCFLLHAIRFISHSHSHLDFIINIYCI